MEQSDSIAALAAALAKAQGQIKGALMDSENPHFRNKYADLASVWDACREALSSNGVAVIQSPGEIRDGRMYMTTLLCHASGEWVRDVASLPLAKVDAQGYGSATTYARRYALAAFVGVAPADDDGNAATAAAPKPKEFTAAPEKPPSRAALKRSSIYETLRDEMDACTTLAELDAWNARREADIKALPKDWYEALGDRFQICREELEAASISGADEMDAAFRATVGGRDAPVARNGRDMADAH